MSEIPSPKEKAAPGSVDPQAPLPTYQPGDLVVSRVRTLSKPEGWKFALDQPAESAVVAAGRSLRFKGWVIDPRGPVADVLVIRERDGSEVGQLPVGQSRQGVAQAHPQFSHAAFSGFGGRLTFTEPGRYRVEVVPQGGGGVVPAFALSLRDPSAPPSKLLFMHIAKTAGTSVNRFFADSVGAARCAFHIEIDQRWRSAAGLSELEKCAVISGHVTYKALAQRLDLSEYLKVTLLRRPIDHVVSHLAFIRRLVEPSQRSRLLGHSAEIQAFAAKLAATDFTDRKAVRGLVANLEPAERVLVDNCQVRYLAHIPPRAHVDRLVLNVARRNLHCFDIVGFTEKVDEFLCSIATRMSWPQPLAIPEENRHAERYGMDTSNPGLRAALSPLIHFDEALYRYAEKVFLEGNEKPLRRQQEKALAEKSGPEPVTVKVGKRAGGAP